MNPLEVSLVRAPPPHEMGREGELMREGGEEGGRGFNQKEWQDIRLPAGENGCESQETGFNGPARKFQEGRVSEGNWPLLVLGEGLTVRRRRSHKRRGSLVPPTGPHFSQLVSLPHLNAELFLIGSQILHGMALNPKA